VDVIAEPSVSLYPVSVDWSPPFSMLVPLKGAGDRQAGDDVSATLTAWGSWQPALEPHRRPSVGEALIGSLGGRRAEQQVSTAFGDPAAMTTCISLGRHQLRSCCRQSLRLPSQHLLPEFLAAVMGKHIRCNKSL